MKKTVVTFGIAAGVVVVFIAAVLYFTRGAHLQLQGDILKVRTAPIDDKSSVAVVDFRFTNVADYEFTVRTVTVITIDVAGAQSEGTTISEIDAQRLFQAIPLLGQKYNASLVMRDKIPPHATEDRMIAARFEIPEEKLDHRKELLLRIEEADGNVSEIRGR